MSASWCAPFGFKSLAEQPAQTGRAQGSISPALPDTLPPGCWHHWMGQSGSPPHRSRNPSQTPNPVHPPFQVSPHLLPILRSLLASPLTHPPCLVRFSGQPLSRNCSHQPTSHQATLSTCPCGYATLYSGFSGGILRLLLDGNLQQQGRSPRVPCPPSPLFPLPPKAELVFHLSGTLGPPGRAALQAQGSACVSTTCSQACPSPNVFSFLHPHCLAHSRCLGTADWLFSRPRSGMAPSCTVQEHLFSASVYPQVQGVGEVNTSHLQMQEEERPRQRVLPWITGKKACILWGPRRVVTPMATWQTRGLAPSVLHLSLCSPCSGRPTEEAWLFSKESASQLNIRAELRGNFASFHRGGPGRVTEDHRPRLPCSPPRTQVTIPRSQCPLPPGAQRL